MSRDLQTLAAYIRKHNPCPGRENLTRQKEVVILPPVTQTLVVEGVDLGMVMLPDIKSKGLTLPTIEQIAVTLDAPDDPEATRLRVERLGKQSSEWVMLPKTPEARLMRLLWLVGSTSNYARIDRGSNTVLVRVRGELTGVSNGKLVNLLQDGLEIDLDFDDLALDIPTEIKVSRTVKRLMNDVRKADEGAYQALLAMLYRGKTDIVVGIATHYLIIKPRAINTFSDATELADGIESGKNMYGYLATKLRGKVLSLTHFDRIFGYFRVAGTKPQSRDLILRKLHDLFLIP